MSAIHDNNVNNTNSADEVRDKLKKTWTYEDLKFHKPNLAAFILEERKKRIGKGIQILFKDGSLYLEVWTEIETGHEYIIAPIDLNCVKKEKWE